MFAAFWAVDVLVGFLPDFGASTELQIHPDRNVLLFSLAATMLTGLGIGLAPALLARRVDIRAMLAAGGRSVALGGAAFKALIVVQVALSLLLLVGAGLMVQTLRNLRALDLGFAADSVIQVRIMPESSGYTPQQVPELSHRLTERLSGIPGVASVTMAHSAFAGKRKIGALF